MVIIIMEYGAPYVGWPGNKMATTLKARPFPVLGPGHFQDSHMEGRVWRN